jgi:ParB/RepB/Spo0J family partition protein
VTDEESESRNVELDLIDVSPQNVRKTNIDEDVSELAASIEKAGLLQPLVLVKSGERFELIIGQRRLRALRQLRADNKWGAEAPARVYAKLDPTRKLILSLTENLERRPLPFKDAVRAVGILYKKYGKSVPRIAAILGFTPPTIYKYLRLDELPDQVLELVESKKITHYDAQRALVAAAGDEQKATEIAQHLPKMRSDQKSRLMSYSAAEPEASAKRLIQEATESKTEYRVTIILPRQPYESLSAAARKMSLDVESTAARAIVEWLRDKGYKTH